MAVVRKDKASHGHLVSQQSAEERDRPSQATSPVAKPGRKRLAVWSAVAVAVMVLAAVGWLSRGVWMPAVQDAVGRVQQKIAGGEPAHREVAGHVHGDETAGRKPTVPRGHNPAEMLELSEKGRKNVGLSLVTAELRDFHKTISVPAMVVERPARTKITVSAPMTGVITRIYPIRGEAVDPGQALFDLRLTHEDLVQKQTDLLRELEQLDVIKREVARLEQVTSSGAIAGKRLLEQQYEQSKLEAAIRADTQALLLHGLTKQQVDAIVAERRLLQDLTINAPMPADSESEHRHEDLFQVAELAVTKGQQVTVGTPLATLTDHCELYIEGQAFEQDAQALNEAANRGATVTAVIDQNGSGTREIPGLEILYVDNTVEKDSRALKFYVSLPNELARNEVKNGHRFIGWRYRPGQRVQLQVPVETWEDRIVLPVEAAVQDGPDWFVFRKHAGHFDRVPVHIEYRDQRWVVIDNDGTLFPGDTVVGSGAYQMHLALRNKAGGGVDPHAGHNH